MAKQENSKPKQTIRLNKAIADSGYCARRKADELIQAGKVQVNGQVITELGTQIDPLNDKIQINGQPLKSAEKVYLLFHKPVKFVTSRKAGRGQNSIYRLIPTEWASVDPAGRLDQDSSGLLVLSNDGDFLNRITHPRYHLAKQYLVTLNRPLSPEDEQQLKTGVLLEPEEKVAQVTRIELKSKTTNTYMVELITGYNRQIRRSFSALRYRVTKLHRVRFGALALGTLPEGKIRPLTPAEIRQLLAPAKTPNQRQKSTEDKNRKVENGAQNKTNHQRDQQAAGKPRKRTPRAF